ncbi:hypothetical protein IW136_000225, partial [Coemansia sp. RSA 678]
MVLEEDNSMTTEQALANVKEMQKLMKKGKQLAVKREQNDGSSAMQGIVVHSPVNDSLELELYQ